jgi:ketosteroid isomerase-like protein
VDSVRSKPKAGELVDRLCAAVNAHDIEGLVACFADGYVNETPVHPERGFTGKAQVRRNWEQIFGGVPDLAAEATWSADDRIAWSEWEMRGTRRDGVAHLMRGVVIFGVEGDEAVWARFYLEPVDFASGDVNAAVRATLTRQAPGPDAESGAAR